MKMLINGELRDKKAKIEVINPYDNKLIDKVPEGSKEDVMDAIKAAKNAKKTMNDLSSRKIYEILFKISLKLKDNIDNFAELITLETGKPIKDSKEEIKRSIQTIELSAEESKRVYGETVPMDATIGGKGFIGFTIKIPLGVIGAITPFNYPINLALHKIAPAIATKNTIVIKPSSQAPLSLLKLGELFNEFLPPGAINIVTGSGGIIGDEIVKNTDVDKISFTGSVKTGISISKRAGLKKLTMELGGNDPLIVLNDADIEEAVLAATRGSYLFSGQVCIAVKRIILQNSIADDFLQKFVKKTRQLKVGDPMDPKTDIGPLIDENSAINVEKRVNNALKDGAELLCGGKRKANFYMPTVLDNVTSKMELVQEETFGPISPIIRVKDIDEALKVANDTKYGLQSGIFTQSIKNALKAAEKLDTGSVLINKQPTFRTDNMPFGGFKMSGIGKEGIKYAVEDMTKTKLVVINSN
ncbi:MAG: lactaldehyde dehydrogenase [Methanobacteriaceae archaeon]|nr:lactaldehyde dehydrogenase [Methanobacteriaceae archaeon]